LMNLLTEGISIHRTLKNVDGLKIFFD